MSARTPAKVVILLATHNGAQWLVPQLDSIGAQVGVDINVVVSDDESTDSTWPILCQRASTDPGFTLLPRERRFGSANRNFLHLVRTAPIGESTHVAFADQDDVWSEDKLKRAVERLAATRADGYSSSVDALYLDGSKRYIAKAWPQRRLDFLFESPGPGCSIVVTRPLFDAFRDFVCMNEASCDAFSFHDWLLYAYARSTHAVWTIDPASGLLYRQHGANVFGANAGIGTYLRRIGQVRSGAYPRQVIDLCTLVESIGGSGAASAREVADALRAMPTLRRRVSFACTIAWEGRRRVRDRFVLGLLAAFGWLWSRTTVDSEGVVVGVDNRSSGRSR